MATRYIDKAEGVTSTPSVPAAITDTEGNRRLVASLSGAAGLVYDKVANFFKYNGNGAIKTLVDTDSAQTISGKTINDAVITPTRVEYAADGAIGITSHIAVLTKAGVNAMTIAAPTSEGQVIDIVSETSNAHTITGTNLFWAGVTGGPFNIVTLAAFPGYHFRLISSNGLWMVFASGLGTGTVGD